MALARMSRKGFSRSLFAVPNPIVDRAPATAFLLCPVVTRAAENFRSNRIIGLICPFLPPRVFVKCPSIMKMDGRGGGDRKQCSSEFQGVKGTMESSKSLGRNNWEHKGILIGPPMAPRFFRLSDIPQVGSNRVR